ncbi:helix-turn-helix domain-containing protein [Lacticaseibacillus sharpeae]|uniref:helix-turn-helix domain-containing protein n=1 Tax=Lacticaseibacillus sharpeae TaxID=1626 RepID=UPI0006D0F89F|nr:helix-turn-helix transcriptional regulator [Lacticaseibacillus sharpeae]
MLENEIGPIFRELRVRKGISMHDAANGVASLQFLSQFERGETRIGFARLSELLDNIHVSMEELMAVRQLDTTNWLDWWAFALDYAQRTGKTTLLQQVEYPPRFATVVRAINRTAGLGPGATRRNLTRLEKVTLVNTITRSKRYGVFVNILISYTAIALPAAVRRHILTAMMQQTWWDEVPYLRAGTTYTAMWSLAETEVYMGNYIKAGQIVSRIRERLAPSDLFERLGIMALEAEIMFARGNTLSAEVERRKIMGTLAASMIKVKLVAMPTDLSRCGTNWGKNYEARYW